MAFDEGLAHRLRAQLTARDDVVEKKMFGGLAFMVRGNMCIGIIGDELMVRVGKENHEDALAQPFARTMDFTGRPMKGYVYVAPDGFADESDLSGWVERGLDFVLTLPAK